MSKLNVSDVSIGDTLSFSIYGQIGSKSRFSGTVKGMMDGKYVPPTSNAFQNHANIYPVIPEELRVDVQNNHTEYTYLIIDVDDVEYFIGFPWVNASTLEKPQTRKASVVIAEFSDPSTLTLRQVLEQNGYVVETITLV